nr:3669_t:CDS:2 [Entrophospora candida]
MNRCPISWEWLEQEIVSIVLEQPEVEDNEDVENIIKPTVTSTKTINDLGNALTKRFTS